MIKLRHGTVIKAGTDLSELVCNRCKKPLLWDYEQANDQPYYWDVCCGRVYDLFPHTWKVSVHQEEP